MTPHTISAINGLREAEKREVYARLIPPELLDHFHLTSYSLENEPSLLQLNCPAGVPVAEMRLFHETDFPDPILYGHITDTLNGQIHVLLYILNDPTSPRFDVDVLPDGSPTRFGTVARNLPAEIAALEFGLAPGQVRRGLRMLEPAIRRFEHFVSSLGHDMYFTEPLYYHNAVIFERYGFAYTKGRRLMERIQAGFDESGDLLPLLDGTNVFRQPRAAHSIRLRSWALHDRLLGEPFTNVTMYKWVGKSAGINTCAETTW